MFFYHKHSQNHKRNARLFRIGYSALFFNGHNVIVVNILRRFTGEYRIGIKFNDQHIPDSPYKLFISPAMGDAHLLEIGQFPTSGVQADYPAQFIVRKNGAVGQLDAKVGDA